MTGRQKLGWFACGNGRSDRCQLLCRCQRAAPSLQPAGQRAPISVEIPPAVFQGWPANQKPEFVLVLTGQQHSYLKFCGCTERQLGGFERRYNFMTKLRERGWPVFAVDLGDLAMLKNSTPSGQTALQYETAVKCLAALGYSALATGELDFKLPLLSGVQQYDLSRSSKIPRIDLCQFENRAQNFPHPTTPNESMIRTFAEMGGQNGVPRIGVTSVVAPSVGGQVQQPDVKFEDCEAGDQSRAANMDKAKIDFRILLCQGNYEFARIFAGAPNVNKQVDPTFADKFDVILCLSDQEEPPAKQDQDVFGRTNIVRVGHRGRYIGVMGVFRGNSPANPFDKKFQIVEMSEEYETDKDKEVAESDPEDSAGLRQRGASPRIYSPSAADGPSGAVEFPEGESRFRRLRSVQGLPYPSMECGIWEAVIPGSKKKHSHSKAFEALEQDRKETVVAAV